MLSSNLLARKGCGPPTSHNGRPLCANSSRGPWHGLFRELGRGTSRTLRGQILVLSISSRLISSSVRSRPGRKRAGVALPVPGCPRGLRYAERGADDRDAARPQGRRGGNRQSEAYGSAAAALVPYETLRQRLSRGESVRTVADHFDESHDLVLFRVKVTKLYRIRRRRQ